MMLMESITNSIKYMIDMRRGLKIGLIAIGSLAALVVVAVSLVSWLVLTPTRLTGIVNKAADK